MHALKKLQLFIKIFAGTDRLVYTGDGNIPWGMKRPIHTCVDDTRCKLLTFLGRKRGWGTGYLSERRSSRTQSEGRRNTVRPVRRVVVRPTVGRSFTFRSKWINNRILLLLLLLDFIMSKLVFYSYSIMLPSLHLYYHMSLAVRIREQRGYIAKDILFFSWSDMKTRRK